MDAVLVSVEKEKKILEEMIKILKADMELKDESIDELKAERAYMTQENLTERLRNKSLTKEIERLRGFEKNIKQQQKQEEFMNKPQYEFEVETCKESVAMIIGYDGIGEQTEDPEPGNIRFVRMLEGLPENDWIVQCVQEDYNEQLQGKLDYIEDCKQENRGE